jgi:cytochrome c peroxidase
MSCAKCHLANRAFSDGRPTAEGDAGRPGTRNTPSLLNVAYEKNLFWDGRAVSLEEQVRAPLYNPLEQGLSGDRALEDLLNSLPEYRTMFQKAFATASKITADGVAKAIAAYERSLLSGNSAFDRFVYGHDGTALSVRQQNGLALFKGRAGCAQCHTIGESFALFTDQQFHSSSVRLPEQVSRKLPELTSHVLALSERKGSGALNELIAADGRIAALGRFLATRNPSDINRFQTPSLRNVALTAPYMHDGSIGSLDSAVEMELYSRNDTLEKPIILTTEERADIVGFLRALTGAGALSKN